jgi:hypothetical protein
MTFTGNGQTPDLINPEGSRLNPTESIKVSIAAMLGMEHRA